MLMFAWVLLTFPVRQEGVYVVQPHIKDPNPAVFEMLVGKAQQDPLLMDDGRKCHIKVRASGPQGLFPMPPCCTLLRTSGQFYVLLLGFEDGVRWHLYTFKAAPGD